MTSISLGEQRPSATDRPPSRCAKKPSRSRVSRDGMPQRIDHARLLVFEQDRLDPQLAARASPAFADDPRGPVRLAHAGPASRPRTGARAPRSRPARRPPARSHLVETGTCRRACPATISGRHDEQRAGAGSRATSGARRPGAPSQASPIPTSSAIASRPSGQRRTFTPSAASRQDQPGRPAGHTPGMPAGSNESAWSGNTRAGGAARRPSPAGSRGWDRPCGAAQAPAIAAGTSADQG